MREIMFRAWDKGREKFIEDCDVVLTRQGKCFAGDVSTGDVVQIPDEQVQFYTGLKDKNGKEIYEGDVIKQEYTAIIKTDYDPVSYGLIDQETEEGHHIGEVVIIASKGVCMRKPLRYSLEDDKTEISNQYKNVAGYRCEVIGNVYDNPDLIQKAD